MIEKHWQDLIKPNEIEIQSEGAVTRLTAEPLERGFGFTLGAALRRILLSSLEGVAVTAVRIDGVHADSEAIRGVREDLTDVLLNIKEIALRSGNGIDRSRMAIRKRGPAIVTAGDIQADGDVEIVNPDLVICTLDTDAEFSMEFAVGAGSGYVAAERHLIRTPYPPALFRSTVSFRPSRRCPTRSQPPDRGTCSTMIG